MGERVSDESLPLIHLLSALISREHCQHDLADHDQARLFFHLLDHPRTKTLAAKAIVKVDFIDVRDWPYHLVLLISNPPKASA